MPSDITVLDRFIQLLRMRKAMKRIPDGARVLDVGSYDGRLFEVLGPRLGSGVGIDPNPVRTGAFGNYELRMGIFPDESLPGDFDRITMLAVIEHIPRDMQAGVALACARLLKPGGRVVITIPSPIVDSILTWLGRLHILRCVEFHQHYGLDPDEVYRAFSAHLQPVERRRFQFGLNNLFVFER